MIEWYVLRLLPLTTTAEPPETTWEIPEPIKSTAATHVKHAEPHHSNIIGMSYHIILMSSLHLLHYDIILPTMISHYNIMTPYFSTKMSSPLCYINPRYSLVKTKTGSYSNILKF